MEQSGTILYVNGKSNVRGLVQTYLGGQGHNLVFAGCCGDVLTRASEIAPDLILLDAGVSDVVQVCRELRADPALAYTPLVVLTEAENGDARLLGIEAGADDVLSKPLDVIQLRARVKTMIRLSSLRRRVENLEEGSNEHDLSLALDATLASWGAAMELRGVEPEGHTERVTTMAVELGHAMGMSDAALVHVRRGAMVHDIGKMGIPDRIMFKVGPLDADEWDEMRKHPVYAYELLSSIPMLGPALDIPYYHHENWDGTGYPRGLEGREIPLAARIFRIVDVWDALHSDRSYRQAWDRSEVGDHIREHVDAYFDRDVVHVFFDLLS